MNPDIKKRWLAWLRNPANKQGKGHLRRGDRYCCLGGLCELAVEDGIVTREADDFLSGSVYAYDDETAYLPPSVARWAGLEVPELEGRPYRSVRPAVPESPPEAPLTGELDIWNDQGHPFTEIADLIERYL